jgi:hypothetical protein
MPELPGLFTLLLPLLDLLMFKVSGDAGRTVVFVGFVIEVVPSDSYCAHCPARSLVFENEQRGVPQLRGEFERRIHVATLIGHFLLLYRQEAGGAGRCSFCWGLYHNRNPLKRLL